MWLATGLNLPHGHFTIRHWAISSRVVESVQDGRGGIITYGMYNSVPFPISYHTSRTWTIEAPKMSLFNDTIVSGLTALQEPVVGVPTAAGVLLATILLYLGVDWPSWNEKDVHKLGSLSILIACQPFFNRRFDFLKSGFAQTRQNLFSFKVLQVSYLIPKMSEKCDLLLFRNQSLPCVENRLAKPFTMLGVLTSKRDIGISWDQYGILHPTSINH